MAASLAARRRAAQADANRYRLATRPESQLLISGVLLWGIGPLAGIVRMASLLGLGDETVLHRSKDTPSLLT
jgi:hypothetical protein